MFIITLAKIIVSMATKHLTSEVIVSLISKEYIPTLAELFPNAYSTEDQEDVLARVREKWDLSGPLPLPKWDITCPMCQAKMSEGLIQGRMWNLHERNTGGTVSGRCDVGFKCRVCSFVMTFGVLIPKEICDQRRTKSGHHWREVLAIFKPLKK